MAIVLFCMCLIGPILAVFLVCLEFDETHHLIQEWLEIDLETNLANLPFLLMIYLLANNAASVLFVVCFLGLLYLKSVVIWMNGLKPLEFDSKYLRTKCFGTLTESQFVHLWRSHQVINRKVNEAFSSIFVSAHHMLCLIIFVGASFILIRVPDKILEGGIPTLAIFML